jgi:hypothetical protein
MHLDLFMKTIWQATLYDELLSKSKLPSLKVRRMRSLAIEVYKVINKECPVYLQDSIQCPFLNFFNLFCINFPTEMPNKRTIIKIRHIKLLVFQVL